MGRQHRLRALWNIELGPMERLEHAQRMAHQRPVDKMVGRQRVSGNGLAGLDVGALEFERALDELGWMYG